MIVESDPVASIAVAPNSWALDEPTESQCVTGRATRGLHQTVEWGGGGLNV
jgi:hypothetical protein